MGESSPPIQNGSSTEYRVVLPIDPVAALDEVAEVAEIWGADFQRTDQGGTLLLPVSVGVRHGVIRARVTVAPDHAGSVVRLDVEEEHYRVRLGVVVVLLLGALGGLSLTLWPFFPPLLQFVPLGLILATVAWLLVVSRLRTTGPDDFLTLVAAEPERPPPPEPEFDFPPDEVRPR